MTITIEDVKSGTVEEQRILTIEEALAEAKQNGFDVSFLESCLKNN